MAEENQVQKIQVRAAADLSDSGTRFKVITLGGTICSAALMRQAIGINVTSVRSGEVAAAVFAGRPKAYVGAAVNTVGFPLKVANSGWLTPCASGDNTFGRSLALSNSGDLVQVLLDFSQLGYFGG